MALRSVTPTEQEALTECAWAAEALYQKIHSTWTVNQQSRYPSEVRWAYAQLLVDIAASVLWGEIDLEDEPEATEDIICLHNLVEEARQRLGRKQ